MSAFGPGNTYAPVPQPEALTFAGFWVRVGAYLIDAIILSVVNAVMFGAFASSLTGPGPSSDPANVQFGSVVTVSVLSMLIPALYTIGFWLSSGATPGKMALGLRVVSSDAGAPISTGQAIGRFFGYFVSSLVFGLGFLWVAFDIRKQGWHDKLASTVVVRRSSTVPVAFGR
ncbi:RDD family protein [uncultured Enterovirga sp.]|uniref:RDD family protein n=1 Tax=uncultured Enterovirga sp. TaxID=2026352 RepID=UPI0035CA17BD